MLVQCRQCCGFMGSGPWWGVIPPPPCRCRMVDMSDWYRSTLPDDYQIPDLTQDERLRRFVEAIRRDREKRRDESLRIPRGI